MRTATSMVFGKPKHFILLTAAGLIPAAAPFFPG